MYATLLAYFSETTPNKENFKSYRKRLPQQRKRVDEFLIMVNLVLSKVDKTILQSVDSLFSNTNDPYYKGHKVDTREYNYLHKYLDIYGAILDSKIHIMVIDAVPCQYIHKTIWGHVNLTPIYHSYVREGKPHLYILRSFINGTFTYHAISCVVTMMDNCFGHVNFCENCHRVTYLKNGVHKYCGVVTPDMQYGSAYDFALQQNVNMWRPHYVNIQSAINSCSNVKFELSLDDYYDRRLAIQSCYDNGDIIDLCNAPDSSDDDDGSVDSSPKKKQKVEYDSASLLSTTDVFICDHADYSDDC